MPLTGLHLQLSVRFSTQNLKQSSSSGDGLSLGLRTHSLHHKQPDNPSSDKGELLHFNRCMVIADELRIKRNIDYLTIWHDFEMLPLWFWKCLEIYVRRSKCLLNSLALKGIFWRMCDSDISKAGLISLVFFPKTTTCVNHAGSL